ncbi:hypothetical protein OROHE_012342 [Orobanche hederae]
MREHYSSSSSPPFCSLSHHLEIQNSRSDYRWKKVEAKVSDKLRRRLSMDATGKKWKPRCSTRHYFLVRMCWVCRKSELDEAEFSRFHSYVKRGDLVGVSGFPGKTKRGELSIFPRLFVVLSHCLRMMPKQKAGPDANLKKIAEWVRVSPESYIVRDHVLMDTFVVLLAIRGYLYE